MMSSSWNWDELLVDFEDELLVDVELLLDLRDEELDERDRT